MTLAYWCVLIAALIPLGAAAYAKKAGGFRGQDNRHPREFLAHLQGAAARAHAAQQNSYEIFAPFAAAVIIATVSGNAAQGTINFWAVLFILSRLVYLWCYIKDHPTLRSTVWGLGLVCVIALFLAAV